MGRVNKEYKFNNLKGLNTLIDKYGLTKGEAYEAYNVFFRKYGDKIITKCRPCLADASITTNILEPISAGTFIPSGNSKDLDSTAILLYGSSIGTEVNGSLSAITNELGTVTNNVLDDLPPWPDDGTPTRNGEVSHALTFAQLNDKAYLNVPLGIYAFNPCNETTDFTNYGAESAAVALDSDNYIYGGSSISTAITNSNATENGIYWNISLYTNHSATIKVYLSDITSIANIRVRIYEDRTDTNGIYFDFTKQEGGMDLVAGWNTIKVDFSGAGTAIGAGLTATGSVLAGRIKVGAITSANASYTLAVDEFIQGWNQSQGLYTSETALSWSKVKSTSSTLPIFSRITAWDGRIFGIYNNRLYWSNINDGTDFWNAVDTEAKIGSTNSNTTIDNLESTENLKVGLRVTDSAGDIPSDTVISSIDSATAITISEAATGSTAANTITFQGTTSDDSNWMEMDDGDGDKFVALQPLSKDMLILFKKYSIHRIKINTGATASFIPYIRETVFSGKDADGIGCMAPNTVQNILIDGLQNEVWGSSEYIIFQSFKGVYTIGSVGGPIELSRKLPELVTGTFTTSYHSVSNIGIVYPDDKVYILLNNYGEGYAYNLEAKQWSTLEFPASLDSTGPAGRMAAPINVSINKVNRTYFGIATELFYLSTGGFDKDLVGSAIESTGYSYTSHIKYSMYDYDRERFYKYLMNSSSILESQKSSSFANITITAENEDGDTATATITPTASPIFYDSVMKLYGTHISQQYTLTGGGVLHRFIHEIKHTNNKKGV